jgi:hypothetical protein
MPRKPATRRRSPNGSLPECCRVLPTCQHCGGARLRVYKSIDQGDGSRLQFVKCNDPKCGGRSKVIWELPDEFHHVDNEF